MKISKSKYGDLSEEALAAALTSFGVQVTPELASAVRQYVNLLLVWNQKVNLTSVIEPKEILRQHFGESMFAASAVPITSGRLLDVGAGAGFPGLALKLLLGGLDLTLVEANRKKAAFLNEVVRTLKLPKVQVVAGRVEEMHANACIADFVTARAVGNFDELNAWASRALDEGGKLILWLGRAEAQRMRKTSSWNWGEPISIPLSVQRVLLVGTPKREYGGRLPRNVP